MTHDDAQRLIRYVTVIARGLFVLAAVFGLTTLIGAYLVDSLPTTFRATAQIEIVPPSSAPSTAADNFVDPADLNAEIKTLTAPDTLMTVINNLDLDKIWAERVFKIEGRLPRDQALAYLQKNLAVVLKRDTSIIAIQASSSQPVEAAQIANELTDVFRQGKRDVPEDVRILTRAKAPLYASWPNRRHLLIVVYTLATLLCIGVASSVEVVFLLLRAAERPEG